MGQAAEHYVLKVRWVKHGNAFKYQFYPGAALEDSQTVVFEVTIAPLESESDVKLTSIDPGVLCLVWLMLS